MKAYDVSVKRYWFVFGEKLPKGQFVYKKSRRDKPDTLHSKPQKNSFSSLIPFHLKLVLSCLLKNHNGSMKYILAVTTV